MNSTALRHRQQAPTLSSAPQRPKLQHPKLQSRDLRRVFVRGSEPTRTPPGDNGSGNSKRQAQQERDVGVGLKAVWYGAEAFGKLLSLGRKDSPASASSPAAAAASPRMTREQILAAIRADYDAQYFVRGVGDMAAYAPDCTFADPFVSFKGTSYRPDCVDMQQQQQQQLHDNDALPPEEQAAVERIVFKGAHVLTNSEMRLLLTGHINNKKQKNLAYEPPSVMQRTVDYVNKFAFGKNEEAMREIRRVLFNHQLKEFEVGIIANLMPETAEEAKCLVPSLKDPERYPNDEELQIALDEIAQYREFQ